MKNLILIAFVLLGFAACESPIENGDLVYLSLREDKHFSLKEDNFFKCSTKEKLPLVYNEIDDKTFTLKTKEGLNVYYKNYFLRVGEEEADIFSKEKADGKVYLISPELRYVGCNGNQVYQVDKPAVTINHY